MVILFALVALIFGAAPAHAAFLVAPIIAALIPGLTGVALSIVSSLAVAALSIGVSLLLRPQKTGQEQSLEGGVQLDIQMDALVPQSLIVGRAVVAGSRVAIETYGTNNADCIEIIGLADHPCASLVTAYVESQPATLTDTGGDRGSTVDDYDGNLALKFYDGSQVAADAYAVAALSAHAERPWTTSHIGRGRTYVRVHYVYNRDKVPGPLRWKFVVDGIKLYNPAKDTTVGGSGAHRFDDLSTHEHTSNLAVIAYNILRGIRVASTTGDLVHFYGLEGTDAANLPLDNWFAAIAEADVSITTTDGVESQFHGGLEIPVNMEPLQSCKEILKATGGRLVEIGGIYKLYLGAPGLPVVAIDDGVVPANRSDLFVPITPLEEKVTYVEGSYVSVADGWIEKAAPPRKDSDEEELIGRRVPAELKAPMVQSGAHMQRIMQQLLNRAQRERKHNLPLPPSLFGIEPGDVIEWDSTRNGYTSKLFEVVGAEIDANLVTVVSLLEVDPDDYDWSSSDQVAEPDGSLVTARPAAKVISGFAVAAYIHIGENGRRPAIRLTWTDPDDDDLVRVLFDIRTAADISNIAHGDAGDPAAEAAIILAGLLGNTAYQVRARFESFNGFATDWSLWLDVTTPDVGVTAGELDASINALLEQLRVSAQASLSRALDDIREQIEILAQQNNGAWALQDLAVNRMVRSIGQRFGVNEASITTVEEVQVTDRAAIATALQSLIASTSTGLATGLVRFVASSSPDGVVASYAIEVRASTVAEFAFAGFYMDVGVTALGGGSRIRLVSDSIYFENATTGDILEAFLLAVTNEPEDTPIVAGEIQVDLRSRRMMYATTLDEDAEMQFPLGAAPGFIWRHLITQDAIGGRSLDYDLTSFLVGSNPPAIDTDANALSVVEHQVITTSPPVATAVLIQSGTTALGSPRQFSISPPVDGKTIWFLDSDGPCVITDPDTYTITPLGPYLDADFALFGPGGSTGGFGSSYTDGGVGEDTTFAGIMTAGAGGRSLGTSSISTWNSTAAGVAGAASGGDTNTSGNVGGTATGYPGGLLGGDGAAAPTGGGATKSAVGVGDYGQASNGGDGNDPAGGASGGCTLGTSAATLRMVSIGGGASGAKAVRSFGSESPTLLLRGVAYTLVVGDAGAAGTGSGNVGYGPFGDYVPPMQGGKGTAGQATIT